LDGKIKLKEQPSESFRVSSATVLTMVIDKYPRALRLGQPAKGR